MFFLVNQNLAIIVVIIGDGGIVVVVVTIEISNHSLQPHFSTR